MRRGAAGYRHDWLGDGEHVAQSSDSLDMDRPLADGWNVLVAPGRWAQEVAHLIVSPTEAGRTERGLEAAHRSNAAFDDVGA